MVFQKKLVGGWIYLVLCFSFLLPSLANAQTIQSLKGTWKIDYELTMENAKKSPKYTQEMAAKMPEIIKSLMKKMTIEVADDNVIYHMGERNQRMGYAIQSDTSSRAVLKMEIPEHDVFLTFTLLNKDTMNVKSSATDDMDYYIWKKTDQ